MKYSPLNGVHEICRPLRGFINSGALFPGLTPRGFMLSCAPRASDIFPQAGRVNYVIALGRIPQKKLFPDDSFRLLLPPY